MESSINLLLRLFIVGSLVGYGGNASYNLIEYLRTAQKLYVKQQEVMIFYLNEIFQRLECKSTNDSDKVIDDQFTQEINTLENKMNIYKKRILNPFYERF